VSLPDRFFYALSDELLEVVLHEPSADARDVPEALIHDLWEHQRFDLSNLKTTEGSLVAVLSPGRHNTDSGPDFLDARLRIDDTLWSGAAEIHSTSGVWFDHEHERDVHYNSTILHVVLFNDMWTGKLQREDGTILPELVLYPYLGAPLRRLLHSFYMRPAKQIFCAAGWSRVPDEVRSPYLEDLARERIASKRQRMKASGSIEVGLYHDLFAGLGYSKNSAPMRTLAQLVPLEVARSFRDPFDVEALYLGAAGLVPTPSGLLEADRTTADYAMDLRDRFERINHRLEIEPLDPAAWRFFRLRPANFPPLRVAQAASLLHPDSGLLRSSPVDTLRSALRSARPLESLRSLFHVTLPDFWNWHVRLDKRSTKRSSYIGRDRIDALLVNAVIPALARADDDAAIRLLEHLTAEEDEILRPFIHLGTKPAHALEAQGLHQLFRTRCREARCLTCAIGRHLLSLPE